MAKAKTRKVLQLSNNEIVVLQTLFAAIGGDPKHSSRKYTNAMALRLAQSFGQRKRRVKEGNIYFRDIL